jgi:hypothetical protein
MTRFNAFGTHIGISFVIFLIILYFILSHWYPFPFFSTDGGWKGIRIVAFVDVVLGPLLTLIVYKPGKKYLKFDLTVIGCIQAAALSWGIYTVHHERSAAAVLVEDYFTTVTMYDMQRHINADKLRAYSGHIPALIYLNVPEKELQATRLRSLQSGISMALDDEYYAPINKETIPAILTRAFDLAAYVADKPNDMRIYDQFVAAHRQQMANIAFLEWHGRTQWGYIAVRKDSLELIDFLAIQPLAVEKKKIKA